MHMTQDEFIRRIARGESQRSLNLVKNPKTIKEYNVGRAMKSDPELNGRPNFKCLVRLYGHTPESARDHLNTDYSCGFTMCRTCGSCDTPHEGSTKIMSVQCYNCDQNKDDYKFSINRANRGRNYRIGNYFRDCSFHYAEEGVEKNKFLELVRDEFRPIVIDPLWFGANNGAVLNLTQGIFDAWEQGREEGREWREMLPVLGDALEEAGCPYPDMLACLREFTPSRISRECWPLRLLRQAGRVF